MGYINYGISSQLHHRMLNPPTKHSTSIIVIGAGCAGLGTARQLRSKGYKVLVIEGRHRPGGRVHTVKLSCGEHGEAASSPNNTSPMTTPASGGFEIIGGGRSNAMLHSDGSLVGARHGSATDPKHLCDSSGEHTHHHGGKHNRQQRQRNNNSNNKQHQPQAMCDVVTDLGGSIITGIDDNPLATLVKQLRIPMLHISDTCPLYLPDGTTADKEIDDLVEEHYNKIMMENCTTEIKNKDPDEARGVSLEDALERMWKLHHKQLHLTGQSAALARQLIDWHFANLEFGNASLLKDVSLLHWDQDDGYEVEGAHCFSPGCNGRWLRELCHGIPILYNNPVHEIRYCTAGVAVHTAHKVVHGDAVVITVPLGVLKKEDITFNPPLSARKRGAIARLGFGNLNKVVMMFPYVFWDDSIDMFGYVQNEHSNRGEAFLFYSYAHISGGAQLTALIAGEAANTQDQRSDEESAGRVLRVLRNIFEPNGVTVPAPLQVLCTHWGNDPMAYGAYSSMKVGTKGGEDYDILSESVGGRVFFAGEATTKKYPATMHGAFFTGLWTAANVDASLRKTTASRERRSVGVVEEGMQQHRVQGPSGGASMVQRLDLLERGKDVEMTEEMAQELLLTYARLKLLFEDPLYQPDMAFGSFSVFFGPQQTKHAQHAILQIKFATKNRRSTIISKRGHSALYCYLAKDLVYSLADIFPNEKRIAVLSSLPGLVLTKGRQKLPQEAMELIETVLKKRKISMMQSLRQEQHRHNENDGCAFGNGVQAAHAPLAPAGAAAEGGGGGGGGGVGEGLASSKMGDEERAAVDEAIRAAKRVIGMRP